MTDPINDYLEEKLAAKEQQKKNEIELWQKWRDNGKKPEHLEPLLKAYEPVFNQKTRMWKAPQVPESAFKAELQKQFIKRLHTYDPERGTALNTHVEYGLKKALRYNNRYQNLGYIPEGQSRLIGKIDRAQSELKEQLGRPPTNEELADHLGQTPRMIDRVIKSRRRDVPMSHGGIEGEIDYSGSAPTMGGFQEQQIAVAKNILPDIFPNKPEMHTLFNHFYGTNEHPQITRTSELARKMGKSDQQISRMKRVMFDTLGKHIGDSGE